MSDSLPSKEKLPDWLRRWYCLKGEPRFREAADEIERLQRQVAEREQWAAAWHQALETVATVLEVNPCGSPSMLVRDISDAINKLRASNEPLAALDARLDAVKREMATDLYSRAAAVLRAYAQDAGDDHSVGICNCSDIALADELDTAARASQPPPDPLAVSHLRGLVYHWNEFGPEHGLDEKMHYAHEWLKRHDESTSEAKAVTRDELWRLAASAYKDGYGELPTDPQDYSDATRELVDSISPTKEARRDPPGSYRDATGELVIPSKRAGHIYSPMEGTEVCGICRFHKSEHAPEHMPAGETGDDHG